MIFFPAIDLFDGKIVRLTRGDFSEKKYYPFSPLDAAKYFKEEGCSHIHIVDLQGAKEGRPFHLEILEEIASLGLFVQYGGGLRSEESIRSAISRGADRVMIGSLIFSECGMPVRIFNNFGSAAMPALDIRKGRIVHSGWLKESETTPKEALAQLRGIGFSAFLITNTELDGTMSGSDARFYAELTEGRNDIVAAGGITTVQDIVSLKAAGVAGAIVGKSLYEGGVAVADALRATGEGV